MVINPIAVGNYAFLFMVPTLVGRTSDFMMVPTNRLICRWEVMSLVKPTGENVFLLLRYLVVCTVESLSRFYIPLSWFVCSRRWCIDKLGMFHANQTSSFVDPFSYLCFTFVFIILSCLFLAALWSPPEKGLTSWPSCVFVTFSYGFSGTCKVWYLIVSNDDLWLLLCFKSIPLSKRLQMTKLYVGTTADASRLIMV